MPLVQIKGISGYLSLEQKQAIITAILSLPASAKLRIAAALSGRY